MSRRKPIADQVVVITGASSGIGRCTAELLAGRGARVVVTARNDEALTKLVEQIAKHGGEALAVPADVTSEGELREVARAAVERFGRIDTWVNNASVFIQGRVQDLDLAEFRRVLDVNLVGVINGTRCALDAMAREGSGAIIQVSSVMGRRGTPHFSPYAAAKAGIDGFCDALRTELWGSDIHIATIYPPNVDTPIYQHARGKFGTMPKPQLPAIDPIAVARVIARTAEQPRPSRVVGGFGHLYVAMSRLLPTRWVDALLHRTEPLGLTDVTDPGDNLDEPLADVPRSRGGWTRRGWRGVEARDVAKVLPGPALLGASAAGLALVVAGGRAGRPHPLTGERNIMNSVGSNLVANVIKGALAGVAGVWLMDRVGSKLWDREDRRAVAREHEARIDGMDPAHVAANRIAKSFGRELEPAQPHPAGIAVHYALGVGPAMLYAVLRNRAPGLTAGRGLLYGLGLFLLVDELAAPSLRLAAWAPAYPWQAHARGLASHLALGAAIDGGVRVLDVATARGLRLSPA